MARSIQEMHDKFKLILKDDGFFYSALIVLIALASFGLGRLSTTEFMPKTDDKTQISLNNKALLPTTHENTALPQDLVSSDASARKYVASKNGTKYHLLECPGASQIKEENKVFFASKEEAQASGYAPASNCKGI